MQSTMPEKKSSADLQSELDRCDRESEMARIELMATGSPEAYLWFQDWQYEKRLIKQEISRLDLALRGE